MNNITRLRKIKYLGSKNPQALDIAIQIQPVKNINNREITFLKDEAQLVTDKEAEYLLNDKQNNFIEVFED